VGLRTGTLDAEATNTTRSAAGSPPGYYEEGATQVAESDPVAECARRFRTYDPASQTYIKRKGVRASCP